MVKLIGDGALDATLSLGLHLLPYPASGIGLVTGLVIGVEVLESSIGVLLPPGMREMGVLQKLLPAVPLEEVEEGIQWSHRIVLTAYQMEILCLAVLHGQPKHADLAL